MTRSYISGFRKAAAKHGVDPVNLVKAAGLLNLLTAPVSRYFQLLAGGNKASRGMKSFITLNRRLDKLAINAYGNKNRELFDKIRGLQKELQRSARSYDYYALPDDIVSQLQSVGYRGPVTAKTIPALSRVTLGTGPDARSIMSVSNDVRDELSKVRTARWATALLAPARVGLAMAGNAVPEPKKENNRPGPYDFLESYGQY